MHRHLLQRLADGRTRQPRLQHTFSGPKPRRSSRLIRYESNVMPFSTWFTCTWISDDSVLQTLGELSPSARWKTKCDSVGWTTVIPTCCPNRNSDLWLHEDNGTDTERCLQNHCFVPEWGLGLDQRAFILSLLTCSLMPIPNWIRGFWWKIAMKFD